MDTIIDEIRKILKGEKKTEFINQILKEKALTDALRQAGFTPSPEDAQERATERPFGVLSKIQKIDQTDLIKLVETIQKINQIDNIANLGTINQLNTVQQISKINPQGSYNVVIDLINRIAQVDTISTVNQINNLGTLNQLNTIQQINKINPSATENVVIDRVAKISQIDNITNLESISNVGTINKINEITKIKSGMVVSELISNPRFETGDLSGWIVYTGSPSIDPNVTWYGMPSLKMPANSHIGHFLNQGCYGYEIYLFGAVRSDTSDGYIRIYLVFSDLTSESFIWQVSGANAWYYFNSQGSVAKPVIRISIYNPYVGTTTWLSGFVALKAIQTIRQTDRTNLKVQIEREDLITKSWDLPSGTTTLLNAVSGKMHIIYGWDYEVDADGETGFVATIGGTTVKFGRRKTKGVHALTLIHPIICDMNTALAFQSAGNTSLSLRYITE